MISTWRQIVARHRIARHLVASVIVAIPTVRSNAQPTGGMHEHSSRIDLWADRHRVSDRFGDWRSAGLRLVLPSSSGGTVWYADALWRKAFHDEGTYISLGAQQTMGSDWYGFLDAGVGSGDFVLPDARVDVALSRKWLRGRHLVSTAGLTMVDGKRGYRDAGGFFALMVYPTSTMVAELGTRVNRSSPGGVTSQRAFGTLTLGADRRRFVTLRGSGGTEGYQLVGPTTAIRKFTSQDGSASWREWLGHDWGVFAQGERYSNAFYRRTGMTIGLFAHW